MRTFNTYRKAFIDKRKMRDEEMWFNNAYAFRAFSAALANFRAGLAGKKGKAQYVKKPFLQDIDIEANFDEEKAIRKAIATEEMCISRARLNGLPETKIKK